MFSVRRVIAAIIVTVSATAPVLAQDGLCARVHIELEQQVTITRNAFRATFTLINDTDETLTNISVPVIIRDSEGIVANDRFFIEPPLLETLTGVDGDGTLGPGEIGSAVWIIIPLDTAAPTGPEFYGFGGSLSYLSLDGQNFTEFTPEDLEVLPNPSLRLKYFWERNAYSDDPFTAEIEPATPFAIGLMMINDGFGVANNVRIETSQPEIVDNQQGLLIDFELIGTRVGNEDLLSPSLNVSLGNLGPGQISVATWYMITSLQGQFVNYEARFEHLDALGQPRVFDPDLSLIDQVEIFECIRPVMTLETADDDIPDFMTNEVFYPEDPFEDETDPELIDLPDTLHLSDGRVEPLTPVLDATSSVDGEGLVTVDATMPSGWAYIKLPDPFGAAFRLARVTRDDGRELPLVTNAWLTDRTFRDGQSALRNARIHLFDRGGSGRYTLEYAPRVGEPGVAVWRSVASHGSELENVGVDLFPDGHQVEGRLGGIKKLALDFNTPVDPSTVLPSTVTVEAVGLDGEPVQPDLSGLTFTPGDTGTSAIISFAQPMSTPGVYCFSITGITDPFGQVLTQNRRVSVTILPGDITGDRRVNNTDIGAVASLTGLDTVSPGNQQHVRADINRDGRVNEADVDALLPLRGIDARFIHSPCPEDDGSSGFADVGGNRTTPFGGRSPTTPQPSTTFGIGSGPLHAFVDSRVLTELARGVPPELLGFEKVEAGFRGEGEGMVSDPSLIAVKLPEGIETTDAARWLADAGLDVESITPWPVEGWWVSRIATGVARYDVQHDLQDTGAFHSPVLFESDGGFVIPGQRVLVRSDLEQELLASTLGVSVSQLTSVVGPSLWSINTGARDGNEVMAEATRFAGLPGIGSAEPDMIIAAAIPLESMLVTTGHNAGDLAAILLPELLSDSASVPFATGDRLDWSTMLVSAISDPAPFLLSRAADARLLPPNVPAGGEGRRYGRLIQHPSGNPAVVTKLSWLHTAISMSETNEVTVHVAASAYQSTTLTDSPWIRDRLLVSVVDDRLVGEIAQLGVSANDQTLSLFVPDATHDATAAVDLGIAAGYLLRLGLIDPENAASRLDGSATGFTRELVLDLVADQDGDGALTFSDILHFTMAASESESDADLDLNGLIDLNDILLFQRLIVR